MTTEKHLHLKEVFKNRPTLTFAGVLRAWRLSEEMSQSEMAKLLSISRANLCDLEKGRKLPSPSRAVKIARKLGMHQAHAVELVLQDTLTKDRIKFKVTVAAA
jgi:DNA-binding XRE family transcriptional regulator